MKRCISLILLLLLALTSCGKPSPNLPPDFPAGPDTHTDGDLYTSESISLRPNSYDYCNRQSSPLAL